MIVIEEKQAIDAICEYFEIDPYGARDCLADCKEIDIVMCKDCKHRDPEDHKCDCGMFERAGCIFPVADDYFCKYGERRTDV